MKTSFTLLIILAFALTAIQAQTGSITDMDGNVYQTVAIGEQWWMAENLKVTQYSNGEAIPNLTEANDWTATDTGAYCYYTNNSNLVNTYGNLYNWFVASDPRRVCPVGWHVPTDQEWITLEMYLGMSASEADRMTAWRGTDEGDKLKSESFGGNNSSGFNALGTGYRDPEGVYKALGTDNDYWTSTPYDNDGNTEGVLHGLLNTKSNTVRNFHVPGYGFCIRCVRDAAVEVTHHINKPGTVIFPNPAGDQLFVRNAAGNQLTIRTIAGQTVINEPVTAHTHQVDLSALSKGAYLVSVSDLARVQTIRVIVL